jgi:hypothetical protein
MSKVFITLAALSLMACSSCRPKHVEGWAEKDVQHWADKLGYPNVKAVCVSSRYQVDGADADAYCSVVLGDKVNLVYCNAENHNCNVEK